MDLGLTTLHESKESPNVAFARDRPIFPRDRPAAPARDRRPRRTGRPDGQGRREGEGDPRGGEHRGHLRPAPEGPGWCCSGFSYDLYFDLPQDIDHTFEVHGVKLLCDQMSLMYLMGAEVDYVEGLQGAGFKFNNPNVKSTCGCGSSFSV